MRETLTTAAALVILGLSATACAHSSVTPVGRERFPALAPTEDVVVYTAETEVGRPFKVVGLLSYTNPGKYQILTLEDAIPALKEKARSAGANALIIDRSEPVKSGLISTGISVTGRAIRVENASAPPP
jgi:hypothetical protein